MSSYDPESDKGRAQQRSKVLWLSSDKETSCRYFEWVPEEENHMSYQSVSFTKPPLGKSSSEKTGEHFLTKELINDFANNLNSRPAKAAKSASKESLMATLC